MTDRNTPDPAPAAPSPAPAPASSAPAPLEAVAGDLAELKAHFEREKTRARLDAIAQIGDFEMPLSEAQILAIAPKVDPRDPDGMAALREWVAQNPGIVKAKLPPDPVVEELRAYGHALTARQPVKSPFNIDAAIKSTFGR